MTAEQNIAEEFSQIIHECKGKVTFVTREGDRLVADSMLSALVGLTTILSVADEVSLRVECEHEHDCQRILSFLDKHRKLNQSI